ncbi:MAG: thiolase family protein, partial [Dehalococcoidia bacterium]
MKDVAIVGANMIKFGRYPDKDVVRLASDAAIGALKDAGISISDVEVMVSGNLYQSNAMIGQRFMKEIGATGIPVVNVANACATGSTAFREAYLAVASGAYDVALAIGSEQMGKMGLLGGGGERDNSYSTEGVMGTGLMPGV